MLACVNSSRWCVPVGQYGCFISIGLYRVLISSTRDRPARQRALTMMCHLVRLTNRCISYGIAFFPPSGEIDPSFSSGESPGGCTPLGASAARPIAVALAELPWLIEETLDLQAGGQPEGCAVADHAHTRDGHQVRRVTSNPPESARFRGGRAWCVLCSSPGRADRVHRSRTGPPTTRFWYPPAAGGVRRCGRRASAAPWVWR